jgi:hypothetical protein
MRDLWLIVERQCLCDCSQQVCCLAVSRGMAVQLGAPINTDLRRSYEPCGTCAHCQPVHCHQFVRWMVRGVLCRPPFDSPLPRSTAVNRQQCKARPTTTSPALSFKQCIVRLTWMSENDIEEFSGYGVTKRQGQHAIAAKKSQILFISFSKTTTSLFGPYSRFYNCDTVTRGCSSFSKPFGSPTAVRKHKEQRGGPRAPFSWCSWRLNTTSR